MSSLRQKSNSMGDQKIEPNEHYEEVTDSINHGCGQACGNMCSEDVLYLGCNRVHLGNHFKNETEKPSQKCLE